ncbi:variable large family protein (plasmid) [Borrelia puertoricensis]
MMKRITLCALFLTLFLLLSCGSGSTNMEDPKTTFLTSIANLGKGFLDVFTSLSDMVAGALGIKAETKKSDIGKYFSDIEKTVTSVKKKLNTVVAENGNYPKIKEVVDNFITNTLDKIADGAKEAAKGAEGNESIANVAAQNGEGVAGDANSVKFLSEGMRKIVEVVLKDKGNAEAGDSNKAENGDARGANNADGAGKLFITGAGAAGAQADAKKVATDAAKAVGAVTGADILQAMIKDNGDAAKLAANNAANNNGIANTKDAIIAGGIALRAMAQGGKFANSNNADVSTAVKGAAISAVTKALNTLTIAIRDTVDSGLQTINAALATVIQEDKSADSATPADATTGSQQ